MNAFTTSFGWPDSHRYSQDINFSSDVNTKPVKIMQIVGYVPIISLISGIVRIVIATLFLATKAQHSEEKAFLGAHIGRGVAEILQLGLILAIIDGVTHLVRSKLANKEEWK